MKRKSKVESVAGSIPAKVASNAIAVFGATLTPLAAFVPFLVDSLASRRHSERLESMLAELNDLVQSNARAVAELSDDQYKVINEAIAAAFYTISTEKLQVLRNVAKNAIVRGEVTLGYSDVLARLVRDISPEELRFLQAHFAHRTLALWGGEQPPSEQNPGHLVKPGTHEEVCMSGLIHLGLLYAKETQWDTVPYEWSPLAAKLLALVNDA